MWSALLADTPFTQVHCYVSPLAWLYLQRLLQAGAEPRSSEECGLLFGQPAFADRIAGDFQMKLIQFAFSDPHATDRIQFFDSSGIIVGWV